MDFEESDYPQPNRQYVMGLRSETRYVQWEAHDLEQHPLDLLDRNSAYLFTPSTLLLPIVPGTYQIKKKNGVLVQAFSK